MNWADYLGLGMIAIVIIVFLWCSIDGFVRLYKLRNIKLDKNKKQ